MHAGLIGVVVATVGVLAVPAPALGAGQVYWVNDTGSNPISFGNLDGSGGGNLVTTGSMPDAPWGMTIDAATGTVYWANNDNNEGQGDGISFANLDGSGGGILSTPGVTGANPEGVAIDPAAGRIYWANPTSGTIAYANLNGSGGGTLNTDGALLDTPNGVAVDPATGRIYWTNYNSNTTPVSFAALDGSGGGNLTTTGATASSPEGVAIDAATGMLYWANNGSNTDPISFATLDGSGGGNLTTTGATANEPDGVAIDPVAGKVYWVNEGDTTNPVSFASLDGSGGGNLTTTGAAVSLPAWPALLEPPSAAGAPLISGGSTEGSTLGCTDGTWAPDLLGSFLYRAPQSLTLSWTRNGSPITGADGTTLIASAAGSYACQVTATNHAGSTSQTSAQHEVLPPPSCTLRLKQEPSKHALQLTVSCDQAANLTLSGKISISRIRRRHEPKSVRIKSVHRAISAGRSLTFTVSIPKAARSALSRGARESVMLSLRASNADGSSTATKTIKRLKAP